MMKMIFENLDKIFSEEPILRANGVSSQEVEAAEKALKVVFSDDYRQFLRLYGGAVVGPSMIYGLSRSELMDEKLWSVVEVTRHFRKQCWPGTEASYVISMDQAGNPVSVDQLGRVISFDHDAGEMNEVASDFASYLQHCLMRSPGAKFLEL